MSNNVPLGSFFQDNVRVGPYYTGSIPAKLLPFNSTQNLSYSSYSNYGPGILMSPQNTWNITPRPAAVDNLVATTPAASLPSATYLTLLGDNLATHASGGVVQFDWPRVPTVTVSGAVSGLLRVTIFGTDWYGFPMQHTYVINDVGTYPNITLGNGTSGSLDIPAKAFYTVTNVYLNGGLATGSSISLGVADVFGLPFRVDFSDIISIGWLGASELTVYPPGEEGQPPLTALGVFVPGDYRSTAEAGDTRGLYGPSTPSDGRLGLKFTAYIPGADAWLNQLAATQFVASANGEFVVGHKQLPLTASDLYGNPQFYTGQPS